MKQQLLSPAYWPTWLYLSVLRVAVLLPFSWQLALGRLLGRSLKHLLSARRKVALRNIEHCFPQASAAEQKKKLDQHFLALGEAIFETAFGWWASEKRMRKLYQIEGAEHLQKALEAGNGAILFSAHFTNLELVGVFLAANIDLHAMYRRHHNPVLDFVTRRGREKYAKKVIARDEVRTMIKSLSQNMPVWYAPDQGRAGKYTEIIPFFNQPAVTNTGTSRLAAMRKTPVLPFFAHVENNPRRYYLKIEAALEDFPSADHVADAVVTNQLIERKVKESEAQYLWVHRRFKGLPQPYENIYREL